MYATRWLVCYFERHSQLLLLYGDCLMCAAGMFALPKAFAGLGLLGGTAMVAGVAAMTYLSCSVMLR